MFIRFCKAVLTGSFTAAAIPLFFTTILAVSLLGDQSFNIGASLYLAILPLIVTTPIVLLASILIGLPLTLFLRWCGRESTFAYWSAGGIAGFLIPSASLLWLEGGALGCFLMGGLGMVSGAMTGYVWFRPYSSP